MQSITININAKRINKTANGIVQVPKWAQTIDVAKENTAKNSNKMAAKTNESIGIHLGKQWVSVILNNPHPMAIKNK